MLRILAISIGIFISLISYSQEICDNAIDDDGDGLIDLLDPDCHCTTGLNTIFSNAIPNPDFNGTTCCPSLYWNDNSIPALVCLEDWSTHLASNLNNTWLISYVSNCDSCGPFNNLSNIVPEECTTAVYNGFINIGFYNTAISYNIGHLSFANTCLSSTLLPGITYTLEFEAFNHWQNEGSPVDFSIFGNSSCANSPMPNQTCASGSWVTLDAISPVIPSDSNWHTYTFNFTPTFPINAIALGPSCSPINTIDVTQIYIDNLILTHNSQLNLQISESGHFCTDDYLLSSTIDTIGGSWQWYKDSIAIIGETNDTLDISNLGDGDYTVLYLLNDRCQGLTILSAPLATLYAFANTSDGCANDSILFDGISFIVQPYTITHNLWNFGNGDTSNLEDPYYSYTSPGTYQSYFVVYSNLGCSDTVYKTINILPKPIINYSLNGQCLYDSIDYTDLSTISSGAIDSISWDFDDGSFGNDSTGFLFYPNYGNYNIELYAISDLGCADSLTIPFFVNAIPNSSFTGVDTCAENTFSFVNNSSIALGAINSHIWDFGDMMSSNDITPNHSYDVEGNYNIQLIVQSDSGCVDTSDIDLIIYPNPIIDISHTINCYSASFHNLSTINTGFIANQYWTFGDINSSISTDINPNFNYEQNGNYAVNFIVESDFGCLKDTSLTIIINSNFEVLFSSESPICSGDCIEFINETIEMTYPANYTWTFGDGQKSSLEQPKICFTNYDDSSRYIDAFLKIEAGGGCFDSLNISEFIEVIPTPIADFNFSPDIIPVINPTVQFENTSLKATGYNWDFGNGIITTEINPEIIYESLAKNYRVALTASDASNTCFNTYETTLTIEDEIIFYVPNAFSPLGKSNPIFLPVIYSGVDIYQYRLQIFNRWGEIIFESYNTEVGWDGTYADELVKNGVYVWKIDFMETMSDKTHTQQGIVTVL